MPRRIWTVLEDAALIFAVSACGSQTGPTSAWPRISRQVGGGRTPKDCRKRWFYTLDPSLRRGRWTQEEDAELRLAFDAVGAQWSEIAQRIPGRTDEQIAKRWRDVLSPELKLDAPWTKAEDELLLRLYEEHGAKWTLMSNSFPGRNGIACRNRYRRFRNIQLTGSRPDLQATSHAELSQVETSSSGMSSTESPLTGLTTTNPFFSAFPSQSDTSIPTADHSVVDEQNLDSWLRDTMAYGSSGITRPQDQNLNQQLLDLPDVDIWLDDLLWQQRPLSPAPNHAADRINDINSDTGPTNQNPLPYIDFCDVNTNLDPIMMTTDAVDATAGPIRNVWGLVVALQKGGDTLTLTTDLIRQLLADAAK